MFDNPVCKLKLYQSQTFIFSWMSHGMQNRSTLSTFISWMFLHSVPKSTFLSTSTKGKYERKVWFKSKRWLNLNGLSLLYHVKAVSCRSVVRRNQTPSPLASWGSMPNTKVMWKPLWIITLELVDILWYVVVSLDYLKMNALTKSLWIRESVKLLKCKKKKKICLSETNKYRHTKASCRISKPLLICPSTYITFSIPFNYFQYISHQQQTTYT